MTFAAALRRSERGATLIEFALLLPALLTFIIGITQLGTLFYVNSDLRAAVAEGARLAELYPVPSDSAITTGVSSKFVHLSGSNLTAPTVRRCPGGSGCDSTNANPYIEVSASYRVPLNFIFFTVSPVTLTETRRVFTQVEDPYSTSTSASTSSTSTSSGTTSATSSGTTSSTSSGTTSATSSGATSATSSGTTTSTSATSASSTSTSATSATSASSTSSGTTTSTTSTTSTTGNNASSGNAHTHGNCPTCG
jgi:Flp pilus assembly protein TadG